MQKSVGKTGKCYGFEPQISLFDYLQHLKKSLKWENVHFENIALSDKESVMDFFIPQHRKDATSPGATLVAHADKKDWLQVEVQTNTLDQYCSTHEIRPDFLKIDVEGNEWEVLKGGEKILKQYKPKILVEIEARHIGKEKAVLTFEYLLELGYKGYFINDSEKLPLTQWDFERYQTPGREPYCNNFIFE
jgi:FkbM family methyltransferase